MRARRARGGEEEHDAEVGVGGGPATRVLDRAANGLSDWLRAGVEKGRTDGGGAREKILVARVVKGDAGGDVTGLGRARFEHARELRGGRDLLARHHRGARGASAT